ncbi:MAG: SEL1-like repeat protein [Thermoguttaceae bacterium]|nr:SEL1-like repeat protein [Thermoguttaceae bacterium]
MSCPDPQELRLYFSGDLTSDRFDAVEEHVKMCPRCQKLCEQWELSSNGFSFMRIDSNQTSDDFLKSLDDYIEKAAEADNGELKLPAELISYTLGKKIGEGGMGDVFEAEQKYLKRKVAVKFIRRSKISPEALDRFQNEMEIIGSLSDPHIVSAYDAGEINGMPFLVMEYLEGETVQDLIQREGRISPKAALDIVIQAAKGLATAHAANIVHRDIKPGNLWIDKKGTVKILDLGLARFHSDQSENDEEISGTPDFMAPEQCVGSSSIDARADIYALGCSLYYMITGELPFPTEKYPTTRSKLNAHLLTPLPRLKDAVPKLFSKYERQLWQNVLDAMTAKSPENRYASVKVVIEQLERLKNRHSSFPMILAGYLFSTVSLLLCPGLFALIGIVLACINYKRGSRKHGIVQFTLSVVCGILGWFLGTLAMLNIYEKEEYVPLFKKYFSDEQIPIESEQPLGGAEDQNRKNKKSIPAWEAVYLAKLYEDAQDNDPAAMRTLAWHYYQGKSITKNYVKAFDLYRRAAELNDNVTEKQRQQEMDAAFGMANDGFAPAQRQLGDAYLSGKGVEQDSQKAYEWFLKAAQQGDDKAQFRVAEMLSSGEAGRKDLSEAVKWFLKSAEQGMTESQYALGICYANGEGVEANFDEAERWLLKAARQGDPRHQYQLAKLYRNHGESGKAFSWLEQSAKQGYQPAQQELSKIQGTREIQINVNN